MPTDSLTEKPTIPSEFSFAEKITFAIGGITLVGVVLALMGLGAALSAEMLFRIPHTALYGSPFELLQLATWVVANLFIGIDELLKHPTKYFGVAGMHGATLLSMVIAVGLGLIGTVAKFGRYARLRAVGRNKLLGWIFRKPSIRHDSYSILWARAGFVGACAWVLNVVIAPFLMAGFILIFCVFVAIVPILSIASGDAYVRTYVVAPDTCLPVRDREALLQYWDKKQEKAADSTVKPKPAAMCASIMDGDSVLFSGRVVWTTFEAVLLFDPATGEVRRMSLNNRDVKVVADLSPIQASVLP